MPLAGTALPRRVVFVDVIIHLVAVDIMPTMCMLTLCSPILTMSIMVAISPDLERGYIQRNAQIVLFSAQVKSLPLKRSQPRAVFILGQRQQGEQSRIVLLK